MEKILVTKSSMPEFEEYIGQIEGLWKSRWLTNVGEQHQELSAQLKEFLEAENFELFVNGHHALEIGLQAMGLSGEVITTPFTFISTTQAIVRSGLKPIFCDIDPKRWTIDVNKIEALITEQTCAIVAVHVYGIPCEVDKIAEIAKKYDLKVIYDAAHAFAVRYQGKTISSYGDYSMFSFHATKVFHTIEGGGGVFQESGLAAKIRHIRDFGLCPGGENADEIGTNGKLSEFHAAMGICNLKHLRDEIDRRKWCSDRYDDWLKQERGIQMFPSIAGLERNYAYYPVLFDSKCRISRDQAAEKLRQNGIFARKYFYPITSKADCYHGRLDCNVTPVAEEVSNRILCLPIYADLSVEEVDRICEIILGKNV